MSKKIATGRQKLSITGLNNGGVEGTLYRLCTTKSPKSLVISLLDEGLYGTKLREKGVEVVCLNMQKRFNVFIDFLNF